MDKYVENLVERQAETELNAESNIEETQHTFSELLNNPELRNEVIFDWFVKIGVQQTASDVDTAASIALWKVVADYMDLPFDTLNQIPVFDRSTAWEVASSAMIAGANRQAQIKSGVTLKSFINGIQNADDLQQAVNSMTAKELQEVRVDIKGALKKKKEEKKNG
jgi:hypothetical protein